MSSIPLLHHALRSVIAQGAYCVNAPLCNFSTVKASPSDASLQCSFLHNCFTHIKTLLRPPSLCPISLIALSLFRLPTISYLHRLWRSLSGNISSLPSTPTAVNNCPLHCPFRWKPSMRIIDLQPLKSPFLRAFRHMYNRLNIGCTPLTCLSTLYITYFLPVLQQLIILLF
ncbi:uncharacterized protein LOC105435074 [Cucumis sativus]|uniref:uncharacterized protein LOC105435074 n=1 Tax=Cucumis sativus TaxID=3659 RepID=UPI0012F4F11C|nr:uncharacterized protein LOC105435074 [Cucumis sativus]